MDKLLCDDNVGQVFISVMLHKLKQSKEAIEKYFNIEFIEASRGELVFKIPESGFDFSLNKFKKFVGSDDIWIFELDVSDVNGDYIRRYYPEYEPENTDDHNDEVFNALSNLALSCESATEILSRYKTA